jgi:regulator-associated protein of mTOR
MLIGSGSGMRRVCSLEFSPHMRKSSDSGLADSVLVGGGPFGSVSLPSSNLYRWSCCHFSRPLLEPSHDDHDEEVAARRVERERIAMGGITKCRHSSKSETGFHSFVFLNMRKVSWG